MHDGHPKSGGLNEYGIATYKTTGGYAQAEVDWLCQIGGITINHGQSLGADLPLTGLQAEYDAVFLGIGLGGVNALGLENADKTGVLDAVDFISDLRQAPNAMDVPIGRDVVVIGGGSLFPDFHHMICPYVAGTLVCQALSVCPGQVHVGGGAGHIARTNDFHMLLGLPPAVVRFVGRTASFV